MKSLGSFFLLIIWFCAGGTRPFGHLLTQASRADPGMAAGVNSAPRSSGKFVVMGQVQGQAGRSTCRSGSGSEWVPRVRHCPRIARQGCGQLGTSTAAASPGQGLTAPGAGLGSWAGEEEAPGDARQG